MEGGIAILLIVILVVVVGGAALLVTGGGGVLALRRDRRGDGGDAERPRHTRPRTPAQEHTDFVGTGDDSPPPPR